VAEFTVAGVNYRSAKLNAIQQLRVVKRLMPLFAIIQGADLKGAMQGSDDALQTLIGPLTTAVASIPDDHTEDILALCLGVCTREQANGLGWSQVWNVQAKRPMFDDIDLVQMMSIVGHVLVDSVGDFSHALSRMSPLGRRR
jgi:hypothetical protein